MADTTAKPGAYLVVTLRIPTASRAEAEQWDASKTTYDLVGDAETISSTIEDTQEQSYEVIVGNIGTVYSGPDSVAANDTFAVYVSQSQTGKGRAGDEPVTLMQDGEIIREHDPERPPADDE